MGETLKAGGRQIAQEPGSNFMPGHRTDVAIQQAADELFAWSGDIVLKAHRPVFSEARKGRRRPAGAMPGGTPAARPTRSATEFADGSV